MSEPKRNSATDAIGYAMCSTLLEHILEPMRRIARDAGYAIAVHGSVSRDIDLVAIPWVDGPSPSDPDYLVTRLCAAVASITGRCNPMNDWTEKPHGRRAKMLLVWGRPFGSIDIDLSVMPCIDNAKEETASQSARKNKGKGV